MIQTKSNPSACQRIVIDRIRTGDKPLSCQPVGNDRIYHWSDGTVLASKTIDAMKKGGLIKICDVNWNHGHYINSLITLPLH